jgi:hypothetical protein
MSATFVPAGMIMKLIVFLCAALWAASASAADAPLTVKTLTSAAPAKTAPANARRMTSPTISVTTVTRRADGSLAMDCAQKPNPKLLTERAQNGKSNGAKQP